MINYEIFSIINLRIIFLIKKVALSLQLSFFVVQANTTKGQNSREL